MKAYKSYVNEEKMKIESIEFDIDNEFDFSHDPVTNFCESDNGHSISKANNAEWNEEVNKEIESGEFSLLKCKDCNRYFLLPRTEREWFISRGLTVPKRCTKCRKKKKR